MYFICACVHGGVAMYVFHMCMCTWWSCYVCISYVHVYMVELLCMYFICACVYIVDGVAMYMYVFHMCMCVHRIRSYAAIYFMCSYVYTCYRVSWVRVPPEAAHFF